MYIVYFRISIIVILHSFAPFHCAPAFHLPNVHMSYVPITCFLKNWLHTSSFGLFSARSVVLKKYNIFTQTQILHIIRLNIFDLYYSLMRKYHTRKLNCISKFPCNKTSTLENWRTSRTKQHFTASY